MRFREDESGQTLVLSAVCMVLLMGALSFALDIGLMFRAKRNLQIAADAGAINGAAELGYGDYSAGAKAATALNGATDGVSNTTVTVNNPPTMGSYKGKTQYVEVMVSQAQQTFFMRAFGRNSMTVSARAVAQDVPNTGCIFSLESSPPGGAGLVLNGSPSSLSTPNCGIQVNATGSNSVLMNGHPTLTASYLKVAGTGVGSGSYTLTSPSTVTTNTPVSDPLSGTVPTPTNPGNCTTPAGSGTIGPTSGGSICYSSLTISAATVTMNPGVYYINGNVTISGHASISGSGVTIYVTNGGAVNISGNSTLNLSGPTSGAYSGILFYQDPNDTQTATISGGSSGTLSGIIYMPGTELSLAGGVGATFNVDLVVGWLNISGGASLNSYAPLTGASPLSTPNLAE